MPEGDSVWIAASGLRPLLVGEVLTDARCRWPRVVDGLRGVRVSAVETRGKHLLIRCGDATTLRVHLKMSGRWSFCPAGPPDGDEGLMLATPRGAAICRNAPVIERIDDRELARHPALAVLGPDVLDDAFDPVQAFERVPTGATAGDALLDQRVACGIGNVYRCEVLFLERVHPDTPVAALADPARLWSRAARLMRANCRPGPRNTTGQRRPLHWVYGRAGEGCLRCGRPIVSAMRGDDLPRRVSWCPTCQPADRAMAPPITKPR